MRSELSGLSADHFRLPPLDGEGFHDPILGDYILNPWAKHEAISQKGKLACVLAARNARRNGELKTYIVKEHGESRKFGSFDIVTVGELLSEYPESATQMLDQSLLNLSYYAHHPGTRLNLFEDYRFLFYSENPQEFQSMIGFLKGLDFIERSEGTNYRITPNGWRKVEELKSPDRSDSLEAFVAMAFDPSTHLIYKDGIDPSVTQFGIKPVRVDRVQHNNKICDTIIASILRARFVVADFTLNRGGVYYEAGFAAGKGIPVIWSCHKDHLGDLHFDTRQYNHIVYKTPEELAYKLGFRIQATIGDLPLNPKLEVNPAFEDGKD